MIRVKDHQGNIVPGVYKNSLGAIIVKNDSLLEENRRIHRITFLENKVNELTQLVYTLLNNQRRNING